ncbi:MAG: dihydrolipoyl dehydrogenase [Deltaproteobacteria bacterium]|nr:dihydrolipoyl dehydrogenase [Deltaproteobacteria bacterium]
MSERYDVAVIGGGPGGYVAGIRLGQLGKKAVVIEREHLGGVCLNWGCIPSKAIIHAANVRSEVSGFGDVFSATPDVNSNALQAWKNGIVERQRGGIASLLKANGCQHKRGEANLTGAHSLVVRTGEGGTESIEFEKLVIATGAGVIEIPGFPFSEDVVGYARDAVDYDPIPQNLVIIGGGVIGCELGMAYRKLGASVTIVEMMKSILPGTDKDLLRPIEKSMKKHGITMLTEAKAKGFQRVDGGAQVEIELASGEVQSLPADRILVAVGFRPNTAGLGLEAAGVETDARGWITVDEQCRTNVDHIFAIGDVTGPPLLAHRASHMGEVVAEVLAGKPAAVDVVAMPLGVFTDPELAFAGLSEEAAIASGYDVRTGLFPLAALGRAATMNATDGVIKVVIDGTNDVILGVGIVAANANDLIAEACLALEMGALAEDVALTVHAHPTLAEGLMEAAKAARGEAVHIINRPRRGAAPVKSTTPTASSMHP